MATYDATKNFIMTTDANTSKNYGTESYTFSSAAVSVANNTYTLRQYTIPLSADTRVFNILVNMSDEDSAYHPVDRFERRQFTGTGIKSWATQLTTSGSNATLSVFLVNSNIGASENFAAFSVNVIRRDFVDEI